jgi:hypothetical protein
VSQGKRRGGQDAEGPQNALLTDRAALDVDAGDTQDQIPGGPRRRGRRWWLRQEGAALNEGRGPAAIGEHAQVADADEAVGDDVEQEAPQELVDVEVQDLHAIAFGVIAPAKLDTAIGESTSWSLESATRWV